MKDQQNYTMIYHFSEPIKIFLKSELTLVGVGVGVVGLCRLSVRLQPFKVWKEVIAAEAVEPRVIRLCYIKLGWP